jgi:hypothetical protein
MSSQRQNPALSTKTPLHVAITPQALAALQALGWMALTPAALAGGADHGAAQVITPTTVCSVRTNGGNSTLGVTAISGAKTPRLPVIQVSAQPTQIDLKAHFATVGAKGAAAWFYNEGNSPVQVECKS